MHRLFSEYIPQDTTSILQFIYPIVESFISIKYLRSSTAKAVALLAITIIIVIVVVVAVVVKFGWIMAKGNTESTIAREKHVAC